MSQLKHGAILSYVTILLTNIIGLLITPFMIHKLGKSEYGLYTLIGSLVAYISVLDLGLNNTIIRFVAKYKAKNDRKGEENFLATTFLIYCAISVIIVIIGAFLYFNIETVFTKLTPDQIGKAKIMFIILIFNLALTLPGGTFSAIYTGYEQFVFPRVLNILKYIVRSLTLIVILTLGSQSVGIVIMDTVINIIIILINVYYAFRILKVRFKFHSFEMSFIKEIFSYSIWIFIFAMVGQFQWTAGQIILGITSGTSAVAIYGVGIMLGTYYGAFSTAISEVFLPRATKMTVLDATGEELTDMMIRIGRFSLLVLFFILGGFISFGSQFINLWVGEAFQQTWIIALIIMIAYTLPLSQSFANSILEAKSKFSFKALIYISLIAIGTGIGALLVHDFGVVGLILGSTSGWVLSQIIMNVYYQKVIKLNITRFFRESLSGLFISFLTVLVIGFLLNFIPGKNWINLISKIGIYSFAFVLLMYKFGLNRSEIDIFKGLMPSFLVKK